MNAVGNIAGIVTPITIGYTVDVTAAAPASPSRTGSNSALLGGVVGLPWHGLLAGGAGSGPGGDEVL
ncbi:hypothetical protein ACWGMA_39525, partial [Streptomyces asiaticus]